MSCLFCQIAHKEINADILFEDDQIVAFRDIAPQAPIHILVIPRQHFSTTNDLDGRDTELVGHMVLTAQRVARQLGMDENGYRLVMNCNRDGGQSVYHIHLHLLGGRHMGWPPG